MYLIKGHINSKFTIFCTFHFFFTALNIVFMSSSEEINNAINEGVLHVKYISLHSLVQNTLLGWFWA